MFVRIYNDESFNLNIYIKHEIFDIMYIRDRVVSSLCEYSARTARDFVIFFKCEIKFCNSFQYDV